MQKSIRTILWHSCSSTKKNLTAQPSKKKASLKSVARTNVKTNPTQTHAPLSVETGSSKVDISEMSGCFLDTVFVLLIISAETIIRVTYPNRKKKSTRPIVF